MQPCDALLLLFPPIAGSLTAHFESHNMRLHASLPAAAAAAGRGGVLGAALGVEGAAGALGGGGGGADAAGLGGAGPPAASAGLYLANAGTWSCSAR